MPKGKRHGNLSRKASKIYEALRRKRYSKKSAAKIANSVVSKAKRKRKRRG